MGFRGIFLLGVFAFAQIACTQLQKINDDMDRASRSNYAGPDPSQVVGGREVSRAEPNSKLAVLLLINRDARLSTCTGIVVGRRAVLTAAHCVNGAEPKNVRILFRTRVDERPAGLETLADKIVIHEGFTGQPNSVDLALLQLNQAAPSQYESTALFDEGEKVIDDQVLLLGYGITSETKKDSLTLRKTLKDFKNDFHLKDNIIGIQQNSKTGGFCRGDSGAPIFVKSEKGLKLYGVNSFTVGLEENKECHTASVAMYVPHYSKWIKKHASNM